MQGNTQFRTAVQNGHMYVFLDLGLDRHISEAVEDAAREWMETLDGLERIAVMGGKLTFHGAVMRVPKHICVKHGYLPVKDLPDPEVVPSGHIACKAEDCRFPDEITRHMVRIAAETGSRAILEAVGVPPEDAARMLALDRDARVHALQAWHDLEKSRGTAVDAALAAWYMGYVAREG